MFTALMSHTELVHTCIPINGPTRLKHRAKQKDLLHSLMRTHMIKQQINRTLKLEPKWTYNSQHHVFLCLHSSSTQMDYITVHKVIQTPCLLLKLDIQFTLTKTINLPTQNTNVKKNIFSPSHNITNNILLIPYL